MAVVPRNLVDKLRFFQTRVGKWAADPEAIGTTAEQVASLADKLARAEAALRQQRALQQASQAATAAFNLALDEAAGEGAGILSQVRTRAKTMDDEGVYQLALIPAPAKPSPVDAPGVPTNFTFKLRQTGELELRWACPNPRGAVGTIYHVSRQIGWTGPFEFLGSTGKRRFLDETLPAGASTVAYRVQALRSTAVGMAANYPIMLGTRPGATPTATFSPIGAAKAAA